MCIILDTGNLCIRGGCPQGFGCPSEQQAEAGQRRTQPTRGEPITEGGGTTLSKASTGRPTVTTVNTIRNRIATI